MSNKEHERQSNELMVNAIIKALERAKIPVYKASDELTEILKISGLKLEYQKKGANETVEYSDENIIAAVIPFASSAKILKN